MECLWDLRCSLIGVIELSELSGCAIRPEFINSDLVELHFSMVRGMFYNHTPNVLQYRNVQNSIILSQPIAGCKRKANISASYPKPFALYK